MPGFEDLIDYAALTDDSTVLLKNGALMKVFSLTPLVNIKNENALEVMHDQMRRILSSFDENFILNYDVVTEADCFDGDLSYYGPDNGRALFKERSEILKAETFKTSFYLCVTVLSSKVLEKRAGPLFKKHKTDNSISSVNDTNEILTDALLSMLTTLKSYFKVEECKSTFEDGFISHKSVNFLNQCISGRQQLIRYSSKECLDTVLCNEDFSAGLKPKIGDRHIGVLCIEGMPDETYANMMDCLLELKFEYRLSARFVSFSKDKAQRLLKSSRRNWDQKISSFFDQLTGTSANSRKDLDAQSMVSEHDDFLKEISSDAQSLGALNLNLIVFDTDEKRLGKNLEKASDVLMKKGFATRIETFNATRAYLGSLPGSLSDNLRRALLPSVVVSDLLRLTLPYQGTKLSPHKGFGPDAPSLMEVFGEGSCRARLNLHTRDLGNTLVLGPSGAGKSVFLEFLATSLLRYQNMKVFVFDKGCSFYALTKALRGNHIFLNSEEGLRLSPILNLSSDEAVLRARDYISYILALHKIETDSSMLELISGTLNKIRYCPSEKRTLENFLSIACNHTLNQVLGLYTEKTSLISGESNDIGNAPLTVFECGDFLKRDSKFVYPELLCIFDVIEDSLKGNEPCAIIIDEAWQMLKDTLFASRLLEWLKTIRKLNAFVVMATQSVFDIKNSQFFEDIINSCKCRIFLPNADASSNALFDVYKTFKLSDNEIDEISKGVPKHDLFYLCNSNFTRFTLPLSEHELKLVSLSVNDKEHVDELYKEYKEDFVWQL